ncbi:MAG: hypothetical protein JWO79_4911 [Actinomycetia bacterium]|nr:hypothetical protein [Actinomycetes bacterium]
MFITGALTRHTQRLLPDPGPARVLAAGTLADTLGKGLTLSLSAIFFTRSVGLSVREVSIGLAAAAVVSFLTSTPLGHLADRIGPREVLAALQVAQVGTVGCLAFTRSFWPFLVLSCVSAACGRGASAARGAVVAGLLPPDRRVRLRAQLRAITNVGISAGTVLAGIALQIDTRGAYMAMILGDAASFAVVAALTLRLPHLAPVPVTHPGPRLVALRDRPFLVYTALHGVLAVHYGLFAIAMPLWVTLRTNAPSWIVAVLFLVNGITVVLLQVRASRGTESVAVAARAHRRSGALLAVGCALFAFSGGRSAWIAVVVLVAAAFTHVLGELLQAAGSWGLSFALAPEHAQGQYQGAFDMGYALASIAAPIVVTTLTVGWGAPGWLLLGAMFAVAGALVPPVARWAERNRPHHLDTAEPLAA